MSVLEKARAKQQKDSILGKYRSKLGISDESVSSSLSSILQKMEKDRLQKVYDNQGGSQLQQTLQEQESPAKGFTKFGIFRAPIQTAQDLFLRGQKDKDYLAQIEANNKLLNEIVAKKKTNPEKAADYQVMLDAIIAKNNMLVEATGGELKNKTNLQLAGQAVETAADLMPLGAGVTTAGKMAIGAGGKALAGSLLKEGATYGAISGGANVAQMKEENRTPGAVLGEVVSSIVLGAITNRIVGGVANTVGEKMSKWFNGEDVKFTPKEKDVLKEEAGINDELFEKAGIESPIKTDDNDLIAKTIAASDDEVTISSLIKGKVPYEDLNTVARALKTTSNEDDVARILDEYNPQKIREELALNIATTDNEKKIATLLKGSVSETDIPKVSKILKNVEDEIEVGKILDEFRIKAQADATIKDAPTEKIDSPLEKTEIAPKKVVERDMTDQELATALAKRELARYKETDSRFLANKKGVGMAYSSLKKRLAGDATAREIKNTRKYLESNHIGKEVKVEGKTATVRKNAFGKVGVDFGDGKIKFYSPELVKAKKISDTQVIQKIIDDAKKELEGKNAIYKINRKISEEVDEPKIEKLEPAKQEQKKEAPKEEPKAEPKKSEPKAEKKSDGGKKEEPKAAPTKTKSGLATTTLRDATERGMMKEAESFDVPDLDTMKMKEQADKAVKLIAEDEDLAIRIALGDENPPSGLKVGSVYSAVKELAIKNGDVDLIKRLAQSENVNAFARELGQEIKAFDSQIARDPVKVLKQILDIRKEAAGDGASKAVAKDLKTLKDGVANTTTTDSDVASLMDNIKC